MQGRRADDEALGHFSGVWTSTKDALPDKEGRYITCRWGNNEPYISISGYSFHSTRWTDEYGEYMNSVYAVEYWMPAPQAPVEVSELRRQAKVSECIAQIEAHKAGLVELESKLAELTGGVR